MRTPIQRFSLEQLPDGRYVVVDWAYLNILGSEDPENWYDDDFRTRVYEGLKVFSAERQVVLTKRGFFDALAVGQVVPVRGVTDLQDGVVILQWS